MKTLRKLCHLSLREFWLLVLAAILLPLVRLALLWMGVAKLLRITGRGVRNAKSSLDSQATARAVRIAAQRGLYRAKCLEQSLVLRWLLRRQGVDARIVFGARRENQQMQAHAWVEVNGLPLSEDDGAHLEFLRLEELAPSNVNCAL